MLPHGCADNSPPPWSDGGNRDTAPAPVSQCIMPWVALTRSAIAYTT
jgi:hypothetical protein